MYGENRRATPNPEQAKRIEKSGQTEKIDEKIGNVEKALARYLQFIEK